MKGKEEFPENSFMFSCFLLNHQPVHSNGAGILVQTGASLLAQLTTIV